MSFRRVESRRKLFRKYMLRDKKIYWVKKIFYRGGSYTSYPSPSCDKTCAYCYPPQGAFRDRRAEPLTESA